jgi:DUF4097 and DUF4098 domain-containing protein YvlB
VTPLIVILIGVVFLLKNLNPELRVFEFVFDWWPALLMVWGGLRLVEVLASYFRGAPLQVAGVSGGEWALIVVLTLAGSSVWGVQKLTRGEFGKFRIGGMEVFGETFDYPLDPASRTAGAAPRLVIENLRGSVRVTGADTEEIKVTGRKTVRALNKKEADAASEKAQLSLDAAGGVLTVRTGQEQTAEARVRTALEITAPRGATVEVRGRDLDVDISDVNGAVEVTSDRAGVRLQNIGGKVRADLRGSDLIRGFDLRGDVELKGRGRDIELENVSGQVTISGSYSGETVLRRVAKPVRFDSSVTAVKLEGLPGEMRLSLNSLSAQNVTGPVEVRTRSKDVELADVAGAIEVETERGDVAVRQAAALKAPVRVEVKSGNIDLALPAGAAFALEAETERGAVVNDYDQAFKEEESGRGAKLKGRLGAGPEVRLKTVRGEVSVRKIAPIETAPPKARKAPEGEAPKREKY